jgi:hypothetical protein
MPNLVMDSSKDLMKQPQYEIRICSKPTFKNKGDRMKVEHKKGTHLQKQNNLASLGDEASMRVNTFDMPQKTT